MRPFIQLCLALLLCVSTVASVRYVDNAATGSNDGSSWANAWTNLLWLDRSSNKVSFGDTVYVAARSFTNTGDIRLTGGNVSDGVTNWTRYYFTNGPTTLRVRLICYKYTEIDGGANHDYGTNILGTYDVPNITNNINLHLDRSTNAYNVGTYGRSIIAFSTPVILRWIHATGAHRIDTPVKSDTPNEIVISTSQGYYGPAEIAYCWVDACGGRGSSASLAISANGAYYALGTFSIHHCLVENLETDVFSCPGGTDIHHNIARNRYGKRGGCNDTFILSGSASNIRVYNNLIEPSDNGLYYWPSTSLSTNLHDFYFYGNLLRPVDPTNYFTDVPMTGVGSPDMRCDNGSLKGLVTLSSNIVFAHNTVVGKAIGGPTKLISLGVPQTVKCTFNILPGAFTCKNNLLSCIDGGAKTPYAPLDFYAYNAVTGHNTNTRGYGWTYARNSIIVDHNLFATYTAGNLYALQWGSSPNQPLTTMSNARQIASFLGYTNNLSVTKAIFTDIRVYDYRPSSSLVNIGEDLSSLTNRMPDINQDLYGNVRANWSAGAIEYGTITSTARSILIQPAKGSR